MGQLHHGFNYIELPSTNNAAMKQFYGAAFGWTFEDWGPTYVAIHVAGVDGGFDQESDRKPSDQGSLVILYSDDLLASEASIRSAGAEVSMPAYDFPGGRRFHFKDPSGNELAVWSAKPVMEAEG
ncbi:glyoxalase [Algimonas arctica]|uniref:Glyoxalase n=1 Tax=Algimonas arctica TaxID=1479486 RepID=A0A8J3CTI1_9PROT|nr:VOC family protein [Algimonas arctica]GHA99388.1 glyoxalase [Algimonas arctica]